MKKLREYLSTAEGMKQMMDDVNEILDDFNFGAVYTAMDALSWAWSVPKGMIDEYIQKGKNVHYSKDFPELATYNPDYDDVVRYGRNFLHKAFENAVASDDCDYEWYESVGGFNVTIKVLDDETRKSVFGDDAPDDFKHSVETHMQFVVEENLPKSW